MACSVANFETVPTKKKQLYFKYIVRIRRSTVNHYTRSVSNVKSHIDFMAEDCTGTTQYILFHRPTQFIEAQECKGLLCLKVFIWLGSVAQKI